MVQVVPEASPSLRRTSLLPPNPRNLEAKLCPLSGNFGLAIYGRNEGAKQTKVRAKIARIWLIGAFACFARVPRGIRRHCSNPANARCRRSREQGHK